MLAIIVEDVFRIDRERGGHEVCDLREARRCGCGVEGLCDSKSNVVITVLVTLVEGSSPLSVSEVRFSSFTRRGSSVES